MAIRTEMNGKKIDEYLRKILSAMNTANNGKVIYIRRGELAYEDGEKLFDVTPIE